MRGLRFRADLSVLREGADVAIGFGVRSLEGLGEVAEFLATAVYEHGSLRATGHSVTFIVRNPPLRMGAFHSVRIALDGVWVPGDRAWADVGEPAGPRSLAAVDRTCPITIPIGRRTRFTLDGVDAGARKHRVRLELLSVAIPPLVWYEFTDELRAGAPAP